MLRSNSQVENTKPRVGRNLPVGRRSRRRNEEILGARVVHRHAPVYEYGPPGR